MSAGLVILHSNRLEHLAAAAIGWVRMNPLAPLQEETFLVQSNGMGQWLKLAMASPDGLGICAATRFVMPSRFLWSSYRSVLGAGAVPEHSPLDKSRLLWRLYRLLGQPLEGEVFAPLRVGLGDGGSALRRHALARMLADTYDQYIVYRPDWLQAWEQGLDGLPGPDGRTLEPLADPQRWQAALWRMVVGELSAIERDAGRDRAHRRWVEVLRQRPSGSLPLPPRLHVFGVSSLPVQMIEALVALSAHTQVLLHVLNPCRHFWADIVDGRELLAITRHRHARKPGTSPTPDPVSLAAEANPLLAAWGKQGRDFIGLLYGHDPLDAGNAAIDQFVDPREGGDTLLTALQHAIFDMEALPQIRHVLNAGDDSIGFHVCHSPQREIEVLHDRLLTLFNAPAGAAGCLQPRDVVVMVPDIARYAPAIEAVFGSHAADDARHIPYTIADRTRRSSHPLARALEALLGLTECRLTVTDVMSLLEVPAIRSRFQIDEASLPVVESWLQAAGIRWGLDATHRMSQRLPEGLHHNTWLAGLRRLLAGYALGVGGGWQGITPTVQVSGLEAALLGRLIAFVDALEHLWACFSDSHVPGQWRLIVNTMLDRLFVATDERDEQLLEEFRATTGQWCEACREAGLAEEAISIDVVRSSVLESLDSEGLSQRFLAGRVNFCTLMPMRAIPFRMVCLLGMNDGEYPRRRPATDFDLMDGRYRPGDRSRREDDRYLFMEAILSARERIYLSHVGRSIRDDSVRPASVLVAQLRDWIDACFAMPGSDGAASVSAALTTRHPLQPFSRECFLAGSASQSYAVEWCEALATGAGSPGVLSPFVPSGEALTLEELRRFMRQPVEYFFAHRLRIRHERDELPDFDNEPFVLDALQRHVMAREWVDALRSGVQDAKSQLTHWQRSDRIPAGAWAAWSTRAMIAEGSHVAHALQSLADEFPQELDPIEVSIDLGTDRICDWVGGLRRHEAGIACIHWHGGNIRGKSSRGMSYHHVLMAWLSHLVLSAAGHDVTGFLVTADRIVRLPPMPSADAMTTLSGLCAARRDSLDAPLPVAFKTAMAYLSAVDKGPEKAEAASVKCYEGDEYSPGEIRQSPSLLRTWPDFSSMDGFTFWAERLYASFHQSVSDKRHDEQTS